jgi:hypothetical protein
MTTPTLTSFAAPGGGAPRPSGGRAGAAMTTPTLTVSAWPIGCLGRYCSCC